MQLTELLNKFFTDCFKSEVVRDSFKGKMEKYIVINVNDVKNLKSTKETRAKVLSLSSAKETKMFKDFVKSVGI